MRWSIFYEYCAWFGEASDDQYTYTTFPQPSAERVAAAIDAEDFTAGRTHVLHRGKILRGKNNMKWTIYYQYGAWFGEATDDGIKYTTFAHPSAERVAAAIDAYDYVKED